MEQKNTETAISKKKIFFRWGFSGPLELEYDEIPFYRKRWFVVSLTLLFIPAYILIFDFTGDLYALRDKKVYKFENPVLAKISIFLLTQAIMLFFTKIVFPVIIYKALHNDLKRMLDL
ncbi:MAG: hypothetical protein LBV17_08325 [Treponema sp.]|jgi:hypothetical protein|nr:hypothetical protein [Treponema sp.]